MARADVPKTDCPNAAVAQKKQKILAALEAAKRGGLTKEELANVEKEMNLL